jgi:hypothetical protein
MKSNAHWRYATLLDAIDRAYGPLVSSSRSHPETARPIPRPAAALPR